MKLIFIIFIVFNMIASIVITIVDIYSNRYFKEYENLKSFKNKKLYMVDDFLFVERGTQDTGADNGVGIFVVEGILLSDNSRIRLVVGKEDFLGTNLDRQPLYKSKFTGDIFLKNAPKEYYNYELFSFYIGIYVKLTFYIVIGIMTYFIIRYIKKQKYRI